jgi:enoyl reductase-like protein
MNVCVTGPNGGQVQLDLHANIVLAVKSFAEQLGINRLKTTIQVRLHNKVYLDMADGTEALCESLDERNFIIDVAMFSNWVVNLAHEMVHVKQFARNEMDASLSRWKSNRYAGNIDYWDQPWEKEARRLQFKLAEEFSKA